MMVFAVLCFKLLNLTLECDSDFGASGFYGLSNVSIIENYNKYEYISVN